MNRYSAEREVSKDFKKQIESLNKLSQNRDAKKAAQKSRGTERTTSTESRSYIINRNAKHGTTTENEERSAKSKL